MNRNSDETNLELTENTDYNDEESIQNSETVVSEKRKKKKMSLVSKIIIVICLLVFFIASAVLYRNYVKRQSNIDMNTQLSSIFEDSAVISDDRPDYNFDELRSINPGFVGWINVPNTSISLPVVKYSNNSFYLNHNFYKKYDYRGTVFMDYRNDPENLDANTILYGHNCYDGTMFSELEKFMDVDFYKTTPVVEFYTENGGGKWKIYAVFVTSAAESEDNGYIFNYIYPYMDGDNFDGFINEINKRRLYYTNVDITDEDNMLILSTCVRSLDIYNKGRRTYKADARVVVLARLLRPGESAEVNTENVAVNSSPKYPQIYYDKNGIANPYADDEKWYPQKEAK